jgi:hypothetical protein
MPTTPPRLPSIGLIFRTALLSATATNLCAQNYPARAIRMATPQAHDKFNRAKIAKWIKVAREAGIEPE